MDNSPFGRLSPELRNRIYEFTLYSPGGGLHHPLRQTFEVNRLTRTCRQIRKETHAMLYAMRNFGIRFDFNMGAGMGATKAAQIGEHFCALLQLLGPEIVSRLRRFDIRVYDTSDPNSCWWLMDLVGGSQMPEVEEIFTQTKRTSTFNLPTRVREERDRLKSTLEGMGLDIDAITTIDRGQILSEEWFVTKKPALDASVVSS